MIKHEQCRRVPAHCCALPLPQQPSVPPAWPMPRWLVWGWGLAPRGPRPQTCRPAHAICPALGWPSQHRRRGGGFRAILMLGSRDGGTRARGCGGGGLTRAVPAAPRVPAAGCQCAHPTWARCPARRTGREKERAQWRVWGPSSFAWRGVWGTRCPPSSITEGRQHSHGLAGCRQASPTPGGALGRAAASWRVSFLLPQPAHPAGTLIRAAASTSHVTAGFLCASRPRCRCFGT